MLETCSLSGFLRGGTEGAEKNLLKVARPTHGRSHRRPTVGFFSDLPWVAKGSQKEETFPPVKRLKIPRPKLPDPIRIRFVPETYTF